jgi:hypothetical protein
MSGDMILSEKTLAKLDTVDRMLPEWRELVHEYGYEIVHLARDFRLSPGATRQFIQTVLLGSRSMVNGRGSARRGLRGVRRQLDAVLTLIGAPFHAEFLIRQLSDAGFVLVHKEPNEGMVDASIAETGKLGLVSKREKHRARLRAAIAHAQASFAEIDAEVLAAQRPPV